MRTLYIISVTTAEYKPATVLNTFLRRSGVSKGTKGCCYEGGCGTCLATITAYEPLLKTYVKYTVNSCLYELYACDGTEIVTIEGLGDPTHGLHPIQERLANHDGAQCGFCSPSQVLNMYG
ncbi:xanthine dehydrogenase/oxidase [Elysia marginata]|uniref:Xanthine dehydrogenase/oxidase n=1 Tax=Elysia marginata TaxID=1093978 RepID=A0AAV4JSU9_9GAST|nr:xanthine dehydrogenase/oxidase [Elysia marginata]